MDIQEAKELLARSFPVPKWLFWAIGMLITYAFVTALLLIIFRIQIDNLNSRLIALEFCDMEYNAAEIIKIQENYKWHEVILKITSGVPINKEEKTMFRQRVGPEPRKK